MRVWTLTKLQATQTIVAFLHVVKYIGYDSPYISKASKRYGRKPWASLSMKEQTADMDLQWGQGFSSFPLSVPQLFVPLILGSLTSGKAQRSKL